MSHDQSTSPILWSPTDLVMFLTDFGNVNIDGNDFTIEIVERSSTSALMHVKKSTMIGITLILDVLSSISRLGEARNEQGEIQFFLYTYRRNDVSINLEFMPLSDNYNNNIVALEFIFGQYCIFENLEHIIDNNQLSSSSSAQSSSTNVVANSFETMGVGIRWTLKMSGRTLGHTIRFLGSNITSLTTHLSNNNNNNTQSDSTAQLHRSGNPLQPDMNSINRAIYIQLQAERIHAGARKLSSATLFPVRWTGRQAGKLSQPSSHMSTTSGIAISSSSTTTTTTATTTTQSPNVVSKVLLDTVGGLGNTVSSVYKGITEMINEVGSAVGECAINHARAVHGDEYAKHITQRYLDAVAEIGLAGYNLTNIALIGVTGIVLDAVLEGTTHYFQLYEYLIGPVILQGYIDFLQLPLREPRRMYAVLRPWSLSIYEDSNHFTQKPYKMIMSSMMDTIPLLRKYTHQNTDFYHAYQPLTSVFPSSSSSSTDCLKEDNSSLNYDINSNDMKNGGPPSDKPSSLPNTNSSTTAIESTPTLSTSTTTTVTNPPIDTNDSTHIPTSTTTTNVTTTNTMFNNLMTNIMTTFDNDVRSRIELCTIDGSTYYLYPPIESIDEWYGELKAACLRTESIQTRKTFAHELKVEKRLSVLPRNKITLIQPISIYISTNPIIIDFITECYDQQLRIQNNTCTPIIPSTYHVNGTIHEDVISLREPNSLIQDRTSDGHSLDSSWINDQNSLIGSQPTQSTQVPPTSTSVTADGYVHVDSDDEFDSFFADILDSVPSHPRHRNEQIPPSMYDVDEHLDNYAHGNTLSIASQVHDTHTHSILAETTSPSSTTHVTGHLHSTPDLHSNKLRYTAVPTSPNSTPARNALSTLQEMQNTVGTFLDPWKHALLRSLRVQVTPVTKNNYKVHKECHYSVSSSKLEHSAVTLPVGHTHYPLQGKYYTTTWSRTHMSAEGHANYDISQINDNILKIGTELCIDEIECESLQLSILATSISGVEVELGVGEVFLDSLTLKDQGTVDQLGRFLKTPEISSISSVNEFQGDMIWVNIYHRKTEKYIGRILIKAGQIPVLSECTESTTSTTTTTTHTAEVAIPTTQSYSDEVTTDL